jgi:hypothetical protein
VAGEVWKWDGSAWGCVADQSASYTGSGAIALSGTDFQLSSTGCVAGEVWKWIVTPPATTPAWACVADNDTLGGLTCGANQIAKRNATGTAWECANAPHGVTFTRWGRDDCPTGTTTVYSGYAGGKDNGDSGSGSNPLCLVATPSWDHVTPGLPSGGDYAQLVGVEYRTSGTGLATAPVFSGLHNRNAPCAVCLDVEADVEIMQPGSKVCPLGWNTRVMGYLMANKAFSDGSSYVCVDREAEAAGTDATNQGNSGRWYPVEAIGTDSSLPAAYTNGNEVTCAVCTR